MGPVGCFVWIVVGIGGLAAVQEGTGGNEPHRVRPMPSFEVPDPIPTTPEAVSPVTLKELRVCDNIFADVGPNGVEELIVKPVVDGNNQPVDLRSSTLKKAAMFPAPLPRSEVLWLSKDGEVVGSPSCYSLVNGAEAIDVHPASDPATTETILVEKGSGLQESAIDLSLRGVARSSAILHQNIYTVPGTTVEAALSSLN